MKKLLRFSEVYVALVLVFLAVPLWAAPKKLNPEWDTKKKVSQLIEKIDFLMASRGLDAITGSQLKMACLQKPEVVASLLGDGFFSHCGEKMSPVAVNNFLRTLVEGAKGDNPAAVAQAVRSSFQQATQMEESAAQQKVCELTVGNCHFYNPSGPIALNCSN